MRHVGLALCACIVGGCASSPYSDRYRYQPRPVSVKMTAPEAPQQASVRALATVIGLHRATEQQAQSIDVRLMLENVGEAPATFDPATLKLFDASITPLPEPRVDPPTTLTIAPGQSKTINAGFPLTDRDDYDLEGLNLRWSVTVDGRTLTHSATFNRREIEDSSYYHRPFYPYDPWYYNHHFYHPYSRWRRL